MISHYGLPALFVLSELMVIGNALYIGHHAYDFKAPTAAIISLLAWTVVLLGTVWVWLA